MTQLTFGDAAIENFVRGDLSSIDVNRIAGYFPAAFPIVQTEHQTIRTERFDFNADEHEVTVFQEDSLTWRE